MSEPIQRYDAGLMKADDGYFCRFRDVEAALAAERERWAASADGVVRKLESLISAPDNTAGERLTYTFSAYLVRNLALAIRGGEKGAGLSSYDEALAANRAARAMIDTLPDPAERIRLMMTLLDDAQGRGEEATGPQPQEAHLYQHSCGWTGYNPGPQCPECMQFGVTQQDTLPPASGDMMADYSSVGYELIVSFDGASGEWIHGFEVGRLYGQMRAEVTPIEAMIHGCNREWLRRCAVACGYDMEPTTAGSDEWVMVVLDKARPAPQSPNPSGLSIVKAPLHPSSARLCSGRSE